jgi:hypothetical protein
MSDGPDEPVHFLVPEFIQQTTRQFDPAGLGMYFVSLKSNGRANKKPGPSASLTIQ